MDYTLRPRSLGTLLDNTFDIYRNNFLLFVGISVIPNGTLLLLQLAWIGFVVPTKSMVIIANSPWVVVGGVLAAVFGWFATLFVSSIVTAATTLGVSDVYLDRPTSIRDCFSGIADKAFRVVYVSFVVGLIVAVGFILCIVPGIYWMGKYGVAIPAVVLEDITGRQALDRSSHLTQDAIGRVLVVALLTSVIAVAMALLLDAGLSGLATVFHPAGILTGPIAKEITPTIIGILFGPISAIALTLVYYDQRVRKEAFDIEHMMALMGAPTGIPSGSPVS
jgi:hypothetical protein